MLEFVITNHPSPLGLLQAGAVDEGIAGFHRFFYIDVDPSQPLVDRDPHYRLTLPTKFLRDTFFAIISGCDISRQYQLLRELCRAPQLAGLVYERLVVSVLTSTTNKLPCILNNSTSIALQLPFNSSCTPYELLTRTVPQPNTVYVPEVSQRSYDAFVVFSPASTPQSAIPSKLHGLVLQVTTAKSHTVIDTAVRDLIKDVETKPNYKGVEIEWSYIFVVPNKALGKRLTSAVAVASGISWGAGTTERTITVGYLVVDAKDGGTYSLGEVCNSMLPPLYLVLMPFLIVYRICRGGRSQG